MKVGRGSGSEGGERTARQLVFDLSREPSYDPDEFLVAPCNEVAHASILAWPDWPDRVLLLIGPAGSGKSHLAAIWASRSGARPLAADALDLSAAWGERTAVILEDCDRRRFGEADMFHLLNVVRASGAWLLLTARRPPDQWGVATPDLLSRLRLAPSAVIGRPDETLMKAVMIKLFADRQIAIDAEVVNYAARNCDESLEAVSAFVAAVDETALAHRRRITRLMAVEALGLLNDARADG